MSEQNKNVPKSLLQIVEQLLRTQAQYISETGEILKTEVHKAGSNMNGDLLRLLLSDEETKATFFTDVEGVLVFDKQRFLWLLENKEFLPDSYTRYKQVVGLSSEEGAFLSKNQDVVLSFPYKDAVLVGGQTKDEQKRSEIFFNQVVAAPQIRRMLAPKVFTNVKRYGQDRTGQEVAPILFADSDNLIIKGNNLIALTSLRERYRGQVKLIYIDPPYYFNKTKPSDSFKYNSNFKLSTWLVFMRSRLEIAKELLCPQGVIFCHINEDGMHWLKVLMEEVFNGQNFVETFIWKNTDTPDSLSKKSRSSVEYIICFEKEIDRSNSYIGKDTENGDAPLLNKGNNVKDLTFPKGSIHFRIKDGIYSGVYDRATIIGDCIVKNGTNENPVTLRAEHKWSQQTLNEEIKNGTYFIVKSDKFSIRFQRVEANSMAPEKYIEEQYLSKSIGVGSNEDSNTHLSKMNLNFGYSKPESVVAFLLKAVTQANDIVLDFFLGSGTTAAVAHKMGRRYIGIEQMDYIETIAVERLKKVIEGEQGGISKAVNWQGGGSFVYCELKENAQALIDEILSADEETINEIKERIYRDERIVPYLTREELRKGEEVFSSLSLEDKRQALIDMVDVNKLYVNYSDIDDEEMHMSDAERAFAELFYRKS